MDVLWFRAGKRADENESVFARVDPGKMMVTFDRGDYWQCAYVIAKGQYDAVRARGLDAFRDDVIGMAPILKSGIADVKSWDDVKLLTVAINRLKRWTRPGLLCIGDAAHAMSPVGGVGVNLAVQDAVATANLLAAKLAQRLPVRRRTRRRAAAPGISGADDAARCRSSSRTTSISVALKPGDAPLKAPLPVRLINALPWLQGITARFVGARRTPRARAVTRLRGLTDRARAGCDAILRTRGRAMLSRDTLSGNMLWREQVGRKQRRCVPNPAILSYFFRLNVWRRRHELRKCGCNSGKHGGPRSHNA